MNWIRTKTRGMPSPLAATLTLHCLKEEPLAKCDYLNLIKLKGKIKKIKISSELY